MNDELDIAQMIEDCEQHSDKLTEWECDFIDSIAMQYGRKGTLTEKQSEQLNRIWEKATQ